MEPWLGCQRHRAAPRVVGDLEVGDTAVWQDLSSLSDKVLHVELPSDHPALLIDRAPQQFVQAGIKRESLPNALADLAFRRNARARKGKHT